MFRTLQESFGYYPCLFYVNIGKRHLKAKLENAQIAIYELFHGICWRKIVDEKRLLEVGSYYCWTQEEFENYDGKRINKLW